MPGDIGDVRIRLEFLPSLRKAGQPYPVVRLAVGLDIVWDATINPGVPQSLISRRAVGDLLYLDAVRRLDQHHVLLQDLSIQRQRIPNITVRISPVSLSNELDVLLGFDFFRNYTEIRYHLADQLLTLIDP
ncbi:MAG TPA: hypothetical protein VFI42_18770 [Thermomicrobiaceae bacterium]|nr:hypothetical protein [Thermomicrobiaceae bacterium]